MPIDEDGEVLSDSEESDDDDQEEGREQKAEAVKKVRSFSVCAMALKETKY